MIAVRSLTILGSTGSIGTQALDVAEKLGFPVAALSAGRQIDLLERQVRQFRPAIAAVADEKAAERFRERVKDLPVRVLAGKEGICAAARGGGELVLNAVMGIAGLAPTLAAVDAGKDLALANKETLVTGGELVMRKVREKGVRLLPVDSEHSAIFQCLQGCASHGEVENLILTASGGPFFGWSKENLAQVRPAQALRHPNWKMGEKITVDSATLMNKGMELMEAAWLFSIPMEKIKVLVHRQSIVHSAVSFKDHAVLAQLGVADMRIPIQYALTWPERAPSPAAALDLLTAGPLTFELPDEENFPALRVCREAFRRGGLVPAALNGANEEAVSLFLAGKVPFTSITPLAAAAAETQEPGAVTFEAICQADRAARRFVREKTLAGGKK